MPPIAEQLRAAGIPTFPCWTRYNADRGRFDKGPAVPRGESWRDAAAWPYTDPRLDWSSGVFGVPIPDGVVVLDLDTYKGVTRAAVDAFLGAPLDWERALVQRTISGGEHYAFRCDWPVRQGDSIGLPGFDTRAAGRGFICSGVGYTPTAFGLFALAYPAQLPALPDAARAVLERAETPPPPPLPEGHADAGEIVEALRFIDPGCPRSEWVRVGLALRHQFHDDEPTGLDLFHRWSSGEYWPAGAPDNYVPEHIDGQWGSFKPEGATTIASLFYRAIQAGWRPPATFDTAAAFGVDAAPFERLVTRVREQGGDVLQTAAIVDEIRTAGCNALQVALLAAELKTALRDAGIRDAQVGKLVDSLLAVRALPPQLTGSTPPAGTVLDADTPLHPSAWAPMQTKGAQLKPKGTLRNFEILLAAYGVEIEFDEIRKTLRVRGPSVPAAGVLHDEAALAYLDSLANLNEYPTTAVRSMIMAVANTRTINPVRQWVSSVPWDGRDHVGQLWQQIQLDPAEDARFCELLFRKWLRGAYGIGTGALERFEFVFVMIDPAGGTGKTRFFSTLCPRELRTDSLILDTANKDSVKVAISYWLTELGELDGTFNRSESARLKAFLCLERDEMRLPYGRAYLEYPRRTAWFASVNDLHFLVDPSDNRRFWGVRVAGANYQHTVDMQQVWAQAAAELAAGHAAHLSPQEDQILRARNEGFRTGSPIADALSSLHLTVDLSGPHMTVSELLALAGIGRPSRGDINEASRWLQREGFAETRRSGRRGFSVTVTPRTAAAFKVVQ